MIRTIEEMFPNLKDGVKTRERAVKRVEKLYDLGWIDPNDTYTIITLEDGSFWPVVMMRSGSKTQPGACIHSNIAVWG